MTPIHLLCSHAPDQRLINVWLDLREFSRSANLAFQTGNKFPGDLFQETVISVQYRLLALELGGTKCTLPEITVRLGMLAFSVATLLHIKGLPRNNKDLIARLSRCLKSLSHTAQGQHIQHDQILVFQKLKLWFLFTAYVSLLDESEDEGLLVSTAAQVLASLRLKSWDGVREVMLSHIWIDWVQGGKGQALFQKLLTM